MIQLLSNNPWLKYVLLLMLFAIISVIGYFSTLAIGERQLAKRRLAEAGVALDQTEVAGGLRPENVESAWLKLVERIENE